MRLTHITLFGFKSFAKKTTLSVTHKVTGIVGPNGSGKSNIAEAIRFVLGEQSMKSMRSKLSTDLIYKGSSQLSQASKAVATLTLDNRDKKEVLDANENLASFLVYDEIILARTLFADGTSEYTINDAKVRLKDVQELLALARIGSTPHLIISQGETDRILMASPSDRKELLEDALGLRIYHIRLHESEKKLEHVKNHLREVDLLRKEIAPQLNFLHREVSKLEKIEGEKQELARLFVHYAHFEHKELGALKEKLESEGEPQSLALIASSLEKEINKEVTKSGIDETLLHKKKEIHIKMQEVQTLRDTLSRTIGRLEAEKVFIEKDKTKAHHDSVTLSRADVVTLKEKIAALLDHASRVIHGGQVGELTGVLASLREVIESTFGNVAQSSHIEHDTRLKEIEHELGNNEREDKTFTFQLQELEGLLNDIEIAVAKKSEDELQEERHKRDLIMRHGELKAKIREQEFLMENMKNKQQAFELLEKEVGILVGHVLSQTHAQITEGETFDRVSTLRGIERLKLRIEDAGLSNGREIKEEYETLRLRDEYLSKELHDIQESEQKLLMLIDELHNHIRTHFTEGIKQVSIGFNEMFGEVFKGGKAGIEYFTKEDEEGTVESGIDIKVSLPEKRVRDLSALSGGEKALTSIALAFAMSQIAPPPFMVLDETDAALDESNAKKYGMLLTRLSKNSNLLVITHNRETMSHCDMLYGVTIGADGASKLLSISFGEAEKITQ